MFARPTSVRDGDAPFRGGHLLGLSTGKREGKPGLYGSARLLMRSSVLLWVTTASLLFGSAGQCSAKPLGEGEPFGHDVVLVLDNSASMKKVDPRGHLPSALEHFVAARRASTHVGVVVFDGQARLLVPLAPLDGVARARLAAVLSRLDYRGGLSDIAAGIERAVYELRNRGRRDAARSVFLITDGVVDMGSRAQVETATAWLTEELAQQAAAEGIGVFAIGLSAKADYRLLQSLAYTTGADYFRAHDVESMVPILEQAITRLYVATPTRSADEQAVSAGPALVFERNETTAEYLPAKASAAAPLAFADGSMMGLAADEASLALGRAHAAGEPTRPLLRTDGAVSLTLLVVLVILAWTLWRWRKSPHQESVAGGSPFSSQDAVPRAFLYDLSGATDSALHDVSNVLTVIGRWAPSSKRPDAGSGQLFLDDPTISRRMPSSSIASRVSGL